MRTRREFITTASTAALAGAQGREEWRNRQPGMSYRRLGRTNFQISAVVMGGNNITPDAHDHVLHALDRGLNYLDTAPAYGRGKSEAAYALVIKARPRDSFFLTTKVSLWRQKRDEALNGIFESLSASEQAKLRTAAKDEIERRKVVQPDYIGSYFPGQRGELEKEMLSNEIERQYGRRIDRGKNYRQIVIDSLDESLKRLGTDHVDVLMCPHGANSPETLLNYPEVFEAFETVRKAGKARFLGVSAHSDPAGILEAAAKSKMYSVAMVAYNIVNHGYVDAALEKAAQAGVGVIAMKVARPVYNGRRNGTPDDPARVKLIQDAVPGPLKVPQKAYVWALRNRHLSAVVSEMLDRSIVDDNLPLAAAK